MSEHWPPEWEDPDDESLDGDDLDGDDLDAENLAAVTAVLASMPIPALPAAFEARISAAISAESAARTGPDETAGVSATVRSSSPDVPLPAAAGSGTATAPPAPLRLARGRRGARPPATSRAAGPAGSRPPGRGRRAFQAIGSLAACLVLAGFGYLALGRGATSSSSFSAAAPAAAGSASAFPAAGSAEPATAPRRASGDQASGVSQGPGFLVRETGTRYQRATLAGQARAVVAADGSSLPESTPIASASAGAAASSGSFSIGGYVPPAALAGCVDHLTGNQAPTLVDRATYAGRPAYIIVVPRRAWVVGLGCTAASPELITSVALAGLSGNLRALGSV